MQIIHFVRVVISRELKTNRSDRCAADGAYQYVKKQRSHRGERRGNRNDLFRFPLQSGPHPVPHNSKGPDPEYEGRHQDQKPTEKQWNQLRENQRSQTNEPFLKRAHLFPRMKKDLRFDLVFPDSVLHFEFAAPAFDFEIVENLTHDTSQQSFQVRVVEFSEASYGRIFVGLQ